MKSALPRSKNSGAGPLIDKLSFLKAVSDSGSSSADEERLMQLFQNRAGLKKSYADLKGEFHLLHDRLKQQEGATLRVQEQLDALGDLLAHPAHAYGALVFYQLRGLWKTCHQQLAAFAADLTRAQEAREAARHRADCDADRQVRSANVERRLEMAAARAEVQRQHLANVQQELAGLTAFWHYFERRRRGKSLDSLRQAVVLADAEVGGLHAERAAIAAEPPQAFPGTSLAARRTINLAIIAYAEVLCEKVELEGLAARTKEAVTRRVHEMKFGDRADCEKTMQRVQKAQTAVGVQSGTTTTVKGKMERLRTVCDYRNAADTVPTADSLAEAIDPSRTLRPGGSSQWNVLAEDYWDLYTLLQR
ncbi:MAG: hypothetical protein NVSMB10_17400 [Steroidobacteraceae bacterium]